MPASTLALAAANRRLFRSHVAAERDLALPLIVRIDNGQRSWDRAGLKGGR